MITTACMYVQYCMYICIYTIQYNMYEYMCMYVQPNLIRLLQ